MKRIAIGLMAVMVAAVAGAQDYPSKTMIGVITSVDKAGPGHVTVMTPNGEQKFAFDMASDVIVEGSGMAGKDALKVGLPVRITASGDALDANVDEIEVLNASDPDYKAALAAAPAAVGAAAAAAMPDVAAAPMEEEVVVEEVMVEETFVATSLPKTASPVPLLGLVGAAALAGAALLRRFRS